MAGSAAQLERGRRQRSDEYESHAETDTRLNDQNRGAVKRQ
jgi:hypothetical protein